MRDLNYIGKQFLDLLFPQLCVGCNKNGSLLCADCFVCIDFLDNSQNNFPYPLLCVCDYKQKLAAKIVSSLKYDLIRDLDLVCAQIIFKFLVEQDCLPDEDFFITFVPMHKTKQSLRSFNQSELVANQLGKILNMPVLPMLQKIRKTPAQMTLTQKERQTNLIGAFETIKLGANTPGNKPICAGKKVLLIDDVITTGSTFLECSKMLLASGAAQVHCLAFARD